MQPMVKPNQQLATVTSAGGQPMPNSITIQKRVGSFMFYARSGGPQRTSLADVNSSTSFPLLADGITRRIEPEVLHGSAAYGDRMLHKPSWHPPEQWLFEELVNTDPTHHHIRIYDVRHGGRGIGDSVMFALDGRIAASIRLHYINRARLTTKPVTYYRSNGPFKPPRLLHA